MRIKNDLIKDLNRSKIQKPINTESDLMPISAIKKFDRSKPGSVLALSRVTSQTGKMMTTLHTDVNTSVNNDLPLCNQA